MSDNPLVRKRVIVAQFKKLKSMTFGPAVLGPRGMQCIVVRAHGGAKENEKGSGSHRPSRLHRSDLKASH